MPRDTSSSDRMARVRQVVRNCIERREAGEKFPDDVVMHDHPNLMPELATELRKLAMLEEAERRASRSDSTVTSGPEGASPLLESFQGYTVVGEIHRGGQGVVYRAVQRSTRRDVAIKVMHVGSEGSAIDRARLDREVYILGQLNHPNVVKIHECGESNGQLYYAMDFVDGQPLDAFLADHPLSIRQTLELFLKICDAVSAAHLRGIIHRDLKPGNILVNSAGEPQVLDFGLAKLSDVHEQSRLLTLTGQFVGSLPWASPEQARGDSAATDLRTDVYSLGVVLYHMLTGRFPYDVLGPARDVLTHILEAEPVRPSRIRHQIDHDVETIVLKCLSKEPERRYQSADGLARDVRHYLAGEPIEARRDSGFYLLRKTLRRYRTATVIAGAFVALLVVGFVITTRLLLQTRAEQETARRKAYVTGVTAAQGALTANEVALARRQLEETPREHRGWEWHYLNASLDSSLMVLRGHDGPVRSVAFSPDGSRLASAGEDNSVRIWDWSGTQEIGRLSIPVDAVNGDKRVSLAYAPDGKSLAVASYDEQLHMLDVSAGADPAIIWSRRSHPYAALCLAFSADGRCIASGGWDVIEKRESFVHLWDSRTGEPWKEFGPYDTYVRAVAFAPVGTRLAVAPWDDKAVRVLDIQSGVEEARLEGHHGGIHGIRFTPDGKVLLAASQDQSVGVWNIATKDARFLWGHTSDVNVAMLHPASNRIVSASRDATCRIWDLDTGKPLSVLHGHEGQILSADCDSQGRCIATASQDGTIRLWDATPVRDPACIGQHDESVFGVAFSRDGRWLASVGLDHTCRVWDWVTRKLVSRLVSPEKHIRAVAFSPTDDRMVIVEERNGTGYVWDRVTGRVLTTLRGHTGGIEAVAFSRDGRLVATGSYDHTARVWDPRTGQSVHTLGGHAAEVTAVAFDPHRQWLWSASLDSTIRAWDLANGNQVHALTDHTGRVNAIAFSPDGRRLASSSTDGTLRLRDARTGRSDRVIRTQASALAFTPDGTRLAGVDGQVVRLFNVSTGEEVLVLRDAAAPMRSIAFSPDGTCLVGGGEEWFVRAWDAQPYVVRCGQRKTLLAAEAQMQPVVESLWQKYPDPRQVAAQLRADASLSETELHAALNLVCRQAAGIDPATAAPN